MPWDYVAVDDYTRHPKHEVSVDKGCKKGTKMSKDRVTVSVLLTWVSSGLVTVPDTHQAVCHTYSPT